MRTRSKLSRGMKKAMSSRALSNSGDVAEFFELSPDLCCILTLDGAVIRANPGTERVLGYSSDDFQRMNVNDLVHPEDLGAFASSLEGLEDGHTQFFKFENRF